MINSEHLEIELYPFQSIESKVVLGSFYSKRIRGSNFKDQAIIFVDNKDRPWLWKKLTLISLIREYIVSYLAFHLGIRIPKSIIAKRGYSFGLVQEWLDCKDLPSLSDIQMLDLNDKTELFDLFVFEAWIGALDRHGGNYLASREGKVWAIDFEQCFAKINFGSELCLYYPFIKESKTELKQSISRISNQIREKQLLNYDFLTSISFIKDSRARTSVLYQLKRIFELLKHNLLELDNIVDTYLENSLSEPNFFYIPST